MPERSIEELVEDLLLADADSHINIVRRDDARAALERAVARLREEPRIACGQCHPKEPFNEALLAANAEVPGDSDAGACGVAGVWHCMYRCADCARWFHRQCLRRHFAAHTALTPKGGGREHD